MTHKIFVVVDKTGHQYVIYDHELRDDNTIRIWKYDDDGESFATIIPVTHQNTYLLNIQTEYILDEHDEKVKMSAGFGSIYHLGYFYAVTIITYYGGNVYEQSVIHSESGVKMTDFDMYGLGYRDSDVGTLDYEVRTKLDLYNILKISN